jgi:hypothetical protein
MIIAPDVPPLVTGDAGRLQQVLLNLMTNAVRFTPAGRVVLRVELPAGSAAPSKQGATWVHFSVTDTGLGIPSELEATIFERFAPSDSFSPRKFGGSGLELAISKRLVDLMRGEIGARSLPDAGSEFLVVLPFAADGTPPPAPASVPHGLHVVALDDLAGALEQLGQRNPLHARRLPCHGRDLKLHQPGHELLELIGDGPKAAHP